MAPFCTPSLTLHHTTSREGLLMDPKYFLVKNISWLLVLNGIIFKQLSTAGFTQLFKFIYSHSSHSPL